MWCQTFLGIPPVDPGERRARERRLDSHHRLRSLGGLLPGEARQAQRLLHVGQVGLADLLRGRVVLQVVVAVGEPQATRRHLGHHLFRVLEGLGASESEEHAAAHLEVEPGHQLREVGLRLERIDGGQVGGDGLRAGLLDGLLVHAGEEEVADLALLRRALGVRASRPQPRAGPRGIARFSVAVLPYTLPARLVGRNGVPLLPAAAGEGVEVHAGIDRAVHGRRVETGRVGQFGERTVGGEEAEGQQGEGGRRHGRAS